MLSPNEKRSQLVPEGPCSVAWMIATGWAVEFVEVAAADPSVDGKAFAGEMLVYSVSG